MPNRTGATTISHGWPTRPIRAKAGIEQFRAGVRRAHPGFAARLDEEIRDWDDVKSLDVRIDRLRRWYAPGLLCIGDAAHAMSPAGGVGIDLAVQDAVAAARIPGPVLRAGCTPGTAHLRAVQRRRQLPMRVVRLTQLHLGDLHPSADRKSIDRPAGGPPEPAPVVLPASDGPAGAGGSSSRTTARTARAARARARSAPEPRAAVLRGRLHVGELARGTPVSGAVNYLGNAGGWRRAAPDVVVHSIEVCSNPAWAGTEQTRTLSLVATYRPCAGTPSSTAACSNAC